MSTETQAVPSNNPDTYIEPTVANTEVEITDPSGLDEVDQVDGDQVTNDADSAADTATVEDDTEEVEYEGKVHKVPKELKDALLRQADYTRKTQEVAEQRKQIEAQAESLKQQEQIQREYIQEISQVTAIDARLNEIGKVDLYQLSEENPMEAQKIMIMRQQLLEARSIAVGSIQQKENHRQNIERQKALEAQQTSAKQAQEAENVIRREIKDWSPQLVDQLCAFAREEGWTPEEIRVATIPQIKSLNKAYRASQLAKTAQPPKAAQVQAKPVPQVGSGGAPVRRKLAELPMEEYAKARRAQRK